MRAATWHGENRFTVDDLPEPSPGPGQSWSPFTPRASAAVTSTRSKASFP